MPEMKYTAEVYTAIKESRFDEAIRILEFERQQFPRSRAALSILAFCYYHLADFKNAALLYEELIKVCPDTDDYKLYYAQALFKAAMYPEALRAAGRLVDRPQHAQRIVRLQAAIRYEQDELSACKALLDTCLPDDPDTIVNFAALAYKENDFEGAQAKYNDAMTTLGFQTDLKLNVALCFYKQKQYGPALKHIAEIIEKGVREHPELSVGSNTDGIDVRSVGNSVALQETCLVEAFNLKAAIECARGAAAASWFYAVDVRGCAWCQRRERRACAMSVAYARWCTRRRRMAAVSVAYAC
jgi:tetratricopeptide repeat protein 30